MYPHSLVSGYVLPDLKIVSEIVTSSDDGYCSLTFMCLLTRPSASLIVSQRQTIIQTINSNGATYHGDLSKSVTHLVAVAPQGKKYEFARQWGITVVSFQWITDCLKRGMTLEGQYYDPTLPEERQGQGAWNEVVPEQIQLQKRAREEEAALKAADTGRRKLRRTASAKLGSQNLDIWHDITAGSNKAQVNVDDTFVDGDEHNKAIMQDRNVISLDGSEDKKPIQAPGNQIPSRSLPSHGVFQGRLIFVFGFNAAKVSARGFACSHLWQ